jgi:small GTP-binding protein
MQAINYKIALIGHTKTGKTSFIKNLLHGVYNNTKPTIGVEVYPYDIKYKNVTYRLHFWDCAGDERYLGLGSEYLLDSDMILIFKDINKNNNIFEKLVPENTSYNYISYENENSIMPILELIKNNLFD